MTGYMYVNLKLNEEIWDTFRGAVKFRKGDLSREFTKALSLYLGALDNTLAVRCYYDGAVKVSELINPLFEMFEGNCELLTGSKIVPINEAIGFGEDVLKGVVELCMERGKAIACIDDLRMKIVDMPESVSKIVERLKDEYSVEFEVCVDSCELYVRVCRNEIMLNTYSVAKELQQEDVGSSLRK